MSTRGLSQTGVNAAMVTHTLLVADAAKPYFEVSWGDARVNMDRKAYYVP